MLWVAIIALIGTVVAFGVAARRVLFLYRLATSGQPAPERLEYAKANIGAEIKAQLVELADGLDRIKAHVRRTRSTGSTDAAASDLQRQLDEVHARLDALTKRLDERDVQWVTVQRELGAIDAKIEILISQSR